MKETVKVAVMSVRRCDLDKDDSNYSCASDSYPMDLPVLSGTVQTSYRVYFSDVPFDVGVQIKDALSSITSIQKEDRFRYNLAHDSWMDLSKMSIKFSESISAEAVRILTDKFSQFNFEVTEYPYDVNVLTHKCYKINYQQAAESLTINERPTKALRRHIAQIIEKIKSNPDVNFNDVTIARGLTMELCDKTDIAFVAVDKPQRYEMCFEMYRPILLRLLGCRKVRPRILIRSGVS